jgi:hypothetical protein
MKQEGFKTGRILNQMLAEKQQRRAIPLPESLAAVLLCG